MEIYGNTMENIRSSKDIETCKTIMLKYANGVDISSDISTSNGTRIINLVFERFSLRNSNFMTVYMNMVSENGETEVFFSIKERQQGLINFSFGKKQKMIREITELLSDD